MCPCGLRFLLPFGATWQLPCEAQSEVGGPRPQECAMFHPLVETQGGSVGIGSRSYHRRQSSGEASVSKAWPMD
jgi:hypothetical protein